MGEGDSERTVRLFAYHELRTAFYAEEEDFVDGTVIRRPIDATKLDRERSLVLKRAAKYYLDHVQTACLQAARPADQGLEPSVRRPISRATSSRAGTSISRSRSVRVSTPALGSTRDKAADSLGALDVVEVESDEDGDEDGVPGKSSQSNTPGKTLRHNLARTEVEGSRAPSRQAMRSHGSKRQLMSRGSRRGMSGNLSRADTMLMKYPSFRVSSDQLKFVACRLEKTAEGDVVLVTLRADLTSIQEHSEVATYKRTMEDVIKAFYEQYTSKRSRLAARRASATARRMSIVGSGGGISLLEAARRAAAESRGEEYVPAVTAQIHTPGGAGQQARGFEAAGKVNTRRGSAVNGRKAIKGRRNSIAGPGRRTSAFGGPVSKKPTEVPEGPRGIARLAQPVEMTEHEVVEFEAQKQAAKHYAAALKRLAKLRFFVVERHNARTGRTDLQRYSFDYIVSKMKSQQIVSGAVQLMQDLGLRAPGPGPLRPAAMGLGVGIDSTPAAVDMTPEYRRVARAIEARTGFSAEDKLGAGKFSDPITLAVAPVYVPRKGHPGTRQAVLAVRMLYRRTDFDRERTVQIKYARQKKPRAMPLPLVNAFSSTHSLTRFLFLTIDPTTGDELDRAEMTYAELVAAQKFGLADLADDVIAAMELAEARLHERILDHLHVLRMASKAVELDGRAELVPERKPASRDEAATRVQQAVRRWMVRTRAKRAQELAALVLRSEVARYEVKSRLTRPVRASNIRHWLTGLQTWTIGARVGRAIAAKRRLIGADGRVWIDGGTGEKRVRHPVAPREPKDLTPYNPPMFALQDIRSFVEEQSALDDALGRAAGAFGELDGIPREARLAAQEASQMSRNRGAALVRGFMRFARASFVDRVKSGDYDWVGGGTRRELDIGRVSLGRLESALNSDKNDVNIRYAAAMGYQQQSKRGIVQRLTLEDGPSHPELHFETNHSPTANTPATMKERLESRGGADVSSNTGADPGALIVYPGTEEGDLADPDHGQRVGLSGEQIREVGGVVPLSRAAEALLRGQYKKSADGILRVMVHGSPSSNPAHFMPQDGISYWAKFLDDEATFEALERQFYEHSTHKEVEEAPTPDPVGLTIYAADPYKVPLPPQEIINKEKQEADRAADATLKQAREAVEASGQSDGEDEIETAAQATVVRRARARAALAALADTMPVPSSEALAHYAAGLPSTRTSGAKHVALKGTGDSSWVNVAGSGGKGAALEFVKLYNRTVEEEPPLAEQKKALEGVDSYNENGDAFQRFVFGRMRESAEAMRQVMRIEERERRECRDSGEPEGPYTRSVGGIRARRAIKHRTAAMQQSMLYGSRAAPLLVDGKAVDSTDKAEVYSGAWASQRDRLKGWVKPGKKGKKVVITGRAAPTGEQAARLASSGFSID